MTIPIRHIIAITCIMLSSNAWAKKNYKAEAPLLKPVTIPQLKGGLDISATALFMTPSTSNLDYLDVTRTITETLSTQWMLNYDVNPNYNWGFIFELGYIFPNTAHDIRFDWMAFHSNYDNQHITLGHAGQSTTVVFFPTGREVFFADTDFVHASGTINYKLDALDLSFGQYLTIYERLLTRTFTGLRYARVDSNMTTLYTANWDTDTSFSSAGVFYGTINSSFNGLGPMIGTRANLDLGKGVGFAASFDFALLAGQIGLNANQVIHQNTAGVSTVERNNLSWGTHKIVAPTFDASFGLNYTYLFSNGTELLGELGYRATQYFDVIEQIDRDPSSTFTEPYFSTDVTNFGLRGPYFTLSVKI